jgi:RNA polymerase sigma factor (sigma-70 family)
MNLLLPLFLRATEESERERFLSELLLTHAAPLIRRTLRQRLGLYVNRAGANQANPEAEDLYQDTITRLIQRLNELKADPDRDEIRNFRQYVVRVATNTCNDYLRAKAPARSRLKNSLRDLLDRHPDFAIWKGDLGQQLCGFSAWRGRRSSAASAERARRLEEEPGELRATVSSGNRARRAPLTKVVAELFNHVDDPVELEKLVDIVADFEDVRDYPVESLDDADGYWTRQLLDSTIRCDNLWEAQEVLQRLWEEILRLPQKQRDTFCLGFEDESGDDLFSLLLDAEVVTLPQVASELGLALEQLVALWKEMPMDNAAIARAGRVAAAGEQVALPRFEAAREGNRGGGRG